MEDLSPPSLSIDLIVSTLGNRPVELVHFVQSVAHQTYRNFRLIVVDQSPDGRAAATLAGLSLEAPLLLLHSEVGGARSRNAALARAEADLVAFPDDDCWYPADLLERVTTLLGGHPEWAGMSARSLDASGHPSNMRWDRQAGPVTRLNCWKRAITYTLFLRRGAVKAAGEFDESIGMPWTSGGETDLVLRILRGGGELHYEPSLTVQHAPQRTPWSRDSAGRGYRYGVGAGSIMRRHRYPGWFVGWRVAQLVAASAYLLARGHAGAARFYWAMARGRLRGWLSPGTRPR